MPRKKEPEEREPGDDDEIWPRGAKQPDHAALLDLVKEIADKETSEKLATLEKEVEKAKRIASSNGDLGFLQDMPDTVLDGRLGELCNTYMLLGKRFPLAYAWPALLAVASALAPRHSPRQRLNLFVALSGPVHTGKSQTIRAAQRLLGIEKPQLMQMLAGSAEALARKCGDAKGEPRLFSPDELGHTLEKSHIENASFPYIFNLAFYETQFEIRMGKKEIAEFNASLSILGGLVGDRFDELFSRSATAGLYDRFLFGACPDKFRFSYYPFEADVQRFNLVDVGVSPDVWIEKDVWLAENPDINPRVIEIAIRAAIICASFDGRTLLTAKDLGPARAMVDYQTKIRDYLRPNEGENPEAKFAIKLMKYLERLKGKQVTKRALFHNCNAERCGLTIAERALAALHVNGDIVITPKKEPPIRVSLRIDDEPQGEEE
jgi:hypothetical protein